MNPLTRESSDNYPKVPIANRGVTNGRIVPSVRESVLHKANQEGCLACS